MKTFEKINKPLLTEWKKALQAGDASSDVFKYIARFINLNFSFGNNPLPALRKIFPEYDWSVMFLRGDELFEPFEDRLQFLFEIVYVMDDVSVPLISDPDDDGSPYDSVIAVSLKNGVRENRCAVFGEFWKGIKPSANKYCFVENIMYRLQEQGFVV
jgi:hypothetical protein